MTEGDTVAGGQTYDAGKLNAGGKAIEDEGADLVEAGSKLETDVSMGDVGNAWQHVAEQYTAAISKFRHAVTNYGESARDFGSKLQGAASSYEHGEAVAADDIAQQGGEIIE